MSSGLDFTGQIARVAVPLVGKVIAQVRNNFKMNLKRPSMGDGQNII